MRLFDSNAVHAMSLALQSPSAVLLHVAQLTHLQIELLQEAQACQALQQLAQVPQLVVAEVQVSEELEPQQAAFERAYGVVLQAWRQAVLQD